MSIKRKLRKRRMIALAAAVLFVAICTIFASQIMSLRQKNKQLEARKARLEEILSSEKLRQQYLDDEEAYVQTINYIEEKAKSIGYVYPDEIIFKKAD